MNPLRSQLDRMPKAWRAALGGLAGALFLSCCVDRVAGTSVGTGNPTEIEVAFKDESGGDLSITGDLSVYASTQIPVEGYAPQPLVKVPVSDADRATLKAGDFKDLADSLWPKGSRNGDIFSFNVVVTGESQGAIVRGLTWRKDLDKFGLRDGDPKIDEGVMKASIKGPLVPLVAFQGTVDTATFGILNDYHLFLYGTGYASRLSHGAFVFPKVPMEKLKAFLLVLPKKENLSSDIDSTPVFSLTGFLEAGISNPVVGAFHEQVLLPDSLRIK
jgi:hypothetical protein